MKPVQYHDLAAYLAATGKQIAAALSDVRQR